VIGWLIRLFDSLPDTRHLSAAAAPHAEGRAVRAPPRDDSRSLL